VFELERLTWSSIYFVQVLCIYKTSELKRNGCLDFTNILRCTAVKNEMEGLRKHKTSSSGTTSPPNVPVAPSSNVRLASHHS
jgi:hypothetical protein